MILLLQKKELPRKNWKVKWKKKVVFLKNICSIPKYNCSSPTQHHLGLVFTKPTNKVKMVQVEITSCVNSSLALQNIMFMYKHPSRSCKLQTYCCTVKWLTSLLRVQVHSEFRDHIWRGRLFIQTAYSTMSYAIVMFL